MRGSHFLRRRASVHPSYALGFAGRATGCSLLPVSASNDIIHMMKRDWLVVVVLIVLAACHRDTDRTPSDTPPSGATAVRGGAAGRAFAGYPPIDAACTTKGDCALVSKLRTESGLTGCCSQCNTFEAGTHTWVEEAIRACNAAGPCSDPLNCPMPTRNPFMAVCEQGRCVVRHDPAVWGAGK